jgi:hypothetical protein
VDERFFFRIVNDSVSFFLFHVIQFQCLCVLQSTNGDSNNEELDDESDSQTVFAENRPSTSRGSVSKGLKSDSVAKVCICSRSLSAILMQFYDQGNFMALASTLRSLLLQFKLKGSPMNKSGQITCRQ